MRQINDNCLGGAGGELTLISHGYCLLGFKKPMRKHRLSMASTVHFPYTGVWVGGHAQLMQCESKDDGSVGVLKCKQTAALDALRKQDASPALHI